jgi:hypothetical protein
MNRENERSTTESGALFSWGKLLYKDTSPVPQPLEGQIRQSLGGRNISPDHEKYVGMAAILTTSDYAREGFFEDMQTTHPNGYIVGIGVGGILSMLEGFEPGTLPKGFIMSDINPWVVAAAKLFTSEVTNAPDAQSLIRSLYFQDVETYKNELTHIARKDKTLRQGIKRWKREAPYPPRLKAQELEDTVQGRWSPDIAYSTFVQNTYPHIPSVIFNHFDQLQQFARSGKIASFYTDFRNPDFISAVSSLPDFFDGTNVIYTTNSIDCHTKGRTSDIESFTTLSQYDNSAHEPVFVTATKPTLRMETARSFAGLKAIYSSPDYAQGMAYNRKQV